MGSLVCMCACTYALERNIPGSFLLYFHFMLLCRSKEEGSPVCTNRRPCGKPLSRWDTRKECSHHIRKTLVFLSTFQLHSWWDQIRLLVSLINYEQKSQNEKWLHLTVKPVTSSSDLRAPKWAWPHTGFSRDVVKPAWCTPQQKPARFRYFRIYFGPHGQWHVWESTVIWGSQLQPMRDSRNQRYSSSSKKYLLFNIEQWAWSLSTSFIDIN